MATSRQIKVMVAQPAGESIAKKIKAAMPFLDVCYYSTGRVEEIPAEIWQGCEVLYTERALPSPEVAPNLKWIQFHYAGIDYALETPILKKPDLLVTTLSGVPSVPMGEYAVMMMLALGHRMPELRSHQERAEWPANRLDVFSPVELRKSTVGIIGYGSTGRQIARLCKAFGAKVIVVKRNTGDLVDHGYFQNGTGDPEGKYFDNIYPVEQIQEMLGECDFLVISVPLTASTRKLIGVDELLLMKKGAFLIDVSRGGVVDQTSLLAVMKERHLAGAALDVFPREPLPKDDPIWKCPNVVITPHISGYSPYYREDAGLLFLRNMELYLEGKPLLNLFNGARGY